MLKFEGRSTQKITISCKSFSTGFKIFALGDSGYVLNEKCTRPGLTEGLKDSKARISVSISNSELVCF